MALIFESIQTDGFARLAYLFGDDAAGIAAVFDSPPDVGCCLQLARKKPVSIIRIVETHVHVNFASDVHGLRALAESTKTYLGHEEKARSGFELK